MSKRFQNLKEKVDGEVRSEYKGLKNVVDGEKEFPYKKRVSPSMFDTFTRCPKQWELRYKNKNYEPQDNPDTMFGHVVHQTMERFLSFKYEEQDKEFNLDKVLKEEIQKVASSVKKKFEKEAHKSRNIPFDEKTLEKIYEDSKKIFKEFFDFEPILFKDRFELVGTEEKVSGKFFNGLEFYGIVDIILFNPNKEKFYIVDVKTSRKGWTEYKVNNTAKKTQLLSYKYYFSKLLEDFSLDDIDVAFLIFNREGNGRNERFDYIETVSIPSKSEDVKWSFENLKDFSNEITNSSGYMKNKDYSKNPSYKICKSCPYSTEFNGTGECDQNGERFKSD